MVVVGLYCLLNVGIDYGYIFFDNIIIVMVIVLMFKVGYVDDVDNGDIIFYIGKYLIFIY